MPKSAPRPCRTRGCPLTTDTKEGYCKDHLKEAQRESRHRHRRYDKRRSENPEERKLNRFYKTQHWRKLRDTYIAKNPTCALCARLGRLTVGTVVDHIVERRDGGEDLNQTNLQTLCHRCHTIKTYEEKRKRNNER